MPRPLSLRHLTHCVCVRSWVSLGVFAANNTRGAQVFKLERQEWVRYLQLRVLSHHGDEAVCTLSQLKVHGVYLPLTSA